MGKPPSITDARRWLRAGLKVPQMLVTEPGQSLQILQRVRAIASAQVALRRCRLGHFVAAFGPLEVDVHGRVQIGDRVEFWPGKIATHLICPAGGELEVGDRTSFNYGSSLRATRSIRIGARCMFGSLVTIDDGAGGSPGPIVIEDDVWVGHGAVIEGGARIGKGSVIGANSVVDFDVPPGMLASGNPASCEGLRPSIRPSAM